MKREEIWNERLLKCMEEKGYKSQEAFIQAFNKATNSNCTQTEISRWTRVGMKYNRKTNSKIVREDGTEEKITRIKETAIGFPSYANMVKLAEFLEVSVAYLTGETDASSFNLEKTSQYLKLSPEAIKKLWKMTNMPKGLFWRTGLYSHEIIDMINKLIESEKFSTLIMGLKHIDTADKETKPSLLTDGLEDKYSAEILNTAVEHIDDYYYPDGPELSQEVLAAIDDINKNMDIQYGLQLERVNKMDLYRYRLQKIVEELVDDIFEKPAQE